MNKERIVLIGVNIFLSIVIIVIITIIVSVKKNYLYNLQPFKNVWTNKKKQKLQKLLSDSQTCFKKLNIKFMPAFGTLLGLVRHKGLIQWDDDMDISVDIKDFKKILENKDLFKKLGVVVFLYEKKFMNSFIKLFLASEKNIDGCDWSWPFIDIFTHYTQNQNFYIRDNVTTTKFKKNDIFPMRTNLFENIPMNIPNNVDSILNKYYGNDWMDVCYSSPYNHQQEKSYQTQYKIKCDNISNIKEKIFDNIWIINLERRPDRLKTTKDRLKKINIDNPNIWTAVDAKSEYMVKKYDEIKGFKISIGECACYLSHKNLWAHIYSLNIPYAIIFEDDIVIPPSVTKTTILNQINNSEGFYILFLGYCRENLNVECCKPKIGTATCGHAYVISRNAIAELLKPKNDFSIPIDNTMKNFCKDNLCFLAYNIEDSVNFGKGIIKQDNGISSDLTNKNLSYSF